MQMYTRACPRIEKKSANTVYFQRVEFGKDDLVCGVILAKVCFCFCFVQKAKGNGGGSKVERF